MKSFGVVLLLGLTVIVTFSEAYVSAKCRQEQDRCQSDRQCCTGLCYKGRCAPANENPKPTQNPCHYHKCSRGEVCILQQVQCFAAPCNPIPTCVPRKPDYHR